MLNLQETEKIEFKSQLNESIKKEIIAFANTYGGDIYIGIDDDGNVIGLDNAKQDLESVSNSIRDSIRPDLTFLTSAKVVEIEGSEVIKIEVLKGNKRPYHLSSKGLKPSGVYVRHGITSAPATEDAIRQMIIESDGTVFEKIRCINQELTFDYAKKVFAKKNISFEKANERTLGMVDEDGYYTNLGMLFSDQCENTIKCALYDGNTKLEFRDRKEFSGSVIKQLDEAYEYINLQNKVESNFKGLNRIDKEDYPYYAVREALVNSVVHRDYNFTGSTLIHIFEDRIEFVSVGGLVSGLTLNDIMLGISESRNKNFAACFYRLKLIESYGTGIQRIYESYSKHNIKPEFKIAEHAFVVVLPNINYKSKAIDENVSEYDKVLQMIKNSKNITRKEIEEELKISKSKVNYILKNLLDKNIIQKEGNARNIKYNIKQ